MNDDGTLGKEPAPMEAKPLSSAARRALAEAELRRKEGQKPQPFPVELQGREGPDPVRFGDWEVKGIASDF